MTDPQDRTKPKYPPLWSGTGVGSRTTAGGCLRCAALKRMLGEIDPALAETPACGSCAPTGTLNTPASEKDEKNV